MGDPHAPMRLPKRPAPPAPLLGIQRTYLAELRRSYRSRVEVMQGALETGVQPRSMFSSDGGLDNLMRLCFVHYGVDDIREKIARLRAVLEESLV